MNRQEDVMRVSPIHAAASLAALVAVLAAGPRVCRADDAPDPHASCHGAGDVNAYKRATRSVAEYAVPSVDLVREDGKRVTLARELDDGRPVVLNFIFTSCTTICPVMSQTFAHLQERLGPDRSRIHMVSISIDPEQDTPARLAEYARRFHAGDQWHFYTGTAEASVKVQRAFVAYGGDKMRHTPLTLVRAAPGRAWVRIDGFASPEELAREVREQVASVAP
jgi:protein SCO1